MINLFSLLLIVQNILLPYETLLNKNKKEVQNYMNQHNNYTINNFGISTNDQTLRYQNLKLDQTIIFYFNQQQKCNHIKVLGDIESLQAIKAELSKKYKKQQKNWITHIDNQLITIELKEEDYNFSINYHQ